MALVVGCASGPSPHPTLSPVSRCCEKGEPTLTRYQAVQVAAQLVGRTELESHGRELTTDCAGVTRAIFLQQGIDLYAVPAAGRDMNGVRLIYAHAKRYGTVHRGPVVHPGDLVFFHNTWDMNGDGRANDPLTHVGIVEDVRPDGTVTFISRVAKAIERYRMNLRFPTVHRLPDGTVVNDYLRRKRADDSDHVRYLAAQLFAGFATVTR